MPLNIVYTAQASHTARCTAGTGTPAVGEAVSESIISQRDADRKALSLAQARAQNSLDCQLPPAPEELRFYNDAFTASAICPAGTADNEGTFDPSRELAYTVPAGAFYSLTSVAEANAAAELSAYYGLQSLLLARCHVYYENVEKSATYTCPMPQEGSNSATVAAGTYVSFESQEAVDATAQAAAQSAAQAGVTCVDRYYNTQQTATVSCESPFVGPDSVATVPAGEYLDYTQEGANALAYAAALAQATALADENCVQRYENTEQSVTVTCEEIFGPGYAGSPSSATVPAGTYSSVDSQEEADQLAYDAAYGEAVAALSCTPV